LTAPVTHLWRLLKWGRTLPRHGALRGLEADPLAETYAATLRTEAPGFTSSWMGSGCGPAACIMALLRCQ
jgi:hypothetical protein